ncbi:ubiquitin-like modifier 1 [Fusarium longipes]|uniref:Ubiquitin-related modifier 1 n=1 Tax=Fusarium longipes TaxID=694270 RepID=A0A395RU65_9HYPO|nr:ubiquitin-like modifier 1 [Fusarium longipes]
MAESVSSPRLNIDVEFSLDSVSGVKSSPRPPAVAKFFLECPTSLNQALSLSSPLTSLVPVLSLVPSFSGEFKYLGANIHTLSIPAADQDGKPADIAYLIDHLCQNVMDDSRKDLFVLDSHLRPGILVLINDADWELEGEEAYEIQSGDNILFVSTLHGG